METPPPPSPPPSLIICNIQLSRLSGVIQTKFHHESPGYLEVHPTPVDAGLVLLDVLHPELGRAGAELEVGPGPELCLVAPPRSQVPGAVAGVVTGGLLGSVSGVTRPPGVPQVSPRYFQYLKWLEGNM